MDKRLEVLFLKAKMAEKQGDRLQAAAIYGGIMKVAPGNERARRALAALDAIQPRPPRAVPQDEMAELLALYRAGQMDAASARAIALIQRYPGTAALFSILGIAQSRLGLADNAAKAFRQVIAIDPNYAEGHYNLGNALMDQGSFKEAIASYRRALAAKPDYASAHHNIGNALKELGDLEGAADAFRSALAVKADNFEAHFNLGNTLKELGRPDDAVTAYRQALALRPGNADVLNNLGNALREEGRWEEATATYRQLVAVQPGYGEGHYNLGNALLEQDALDEAVVAYGRAIEIRPDYAEAYNNLGDTLIRQGEVDKAEAVCRQAIAIRPGYANPYNCLGNAHRLRGDFEGAADAWRQALAIKPDYIDAQINLANILVEMGKFAEAKAAYGQAIVDKPDCAVAHCCMGMIELLHGNFDLGWKLYEWRKANLDLRVGRGFDRPLWLGQEDLQGKSLFIDHEQGLGDTIQFIRYAAPLRDAGVRVSMAVQKSLYPLIDGAIPGIELLAGNDLPAEFDYHIPMLSLPLACRTTLDNIPADIPYLSAEPARIRKWQERLGTHGFKIGICWQGSAGSIDRGRSFAVTHFAGIANLPGIRLISLHKGEGEDQLAQLPEGMRVEVPGPDFDPEGEAFLDTAAVMKMCDLVISSDTSIAHLAGAMGVPVWVMLKHVPDWRWLMDRDDSPWYPGMRLFRQPRPRDWDAAFRTAETALRATLEESSPHERVAEL